MIYDVYCTSAFSAHTRWISSKIFFFHFLPCFLEFLWLLAVSYFHLCGHYLWTTCWLVDNCYRSVRELRGRITTSLKEFKTLFFEGRVRARFFFVGGTLSTSQTVLRGRMRRSPPKDESRKSSLGASLIQLWNAARQVFSWREREAWAKLSCGGNTWSLARLLTGSVRLAAAASTFWASLLLGE